MNSAVPMISGVRSWMCGAALVVTASLAVPRLCLAHDVPAEDPKAWKADLAAGFTITGGNSDTTLGTFGFKASKLWEHDEFRGDLNAAYGKSDGDVNTENLRGSVQYNHLFTDRFYGSFRVEGLHDTIAEIEYRFTLGPAVGYYFIKNDRTRLSGEFGPSMVVEKVGSNESTYFALRFSERWEQKLSDTAKFWEQVDYLPQIDNYTENFLINAEAGIEVAINTRFALREVFTWKYDNQPAPKRRTYDIASITSLVYKF